MVTEVAVVTELIMEVNSLHSHSIMQYSEYGLRKLEPNHKTLLATGRNSTQRPHHSPTASITGIKSILFTGEKPLYNPAPQVVCLYGDLGSTDSHPAVYLCT